MYVLILLCGTIAVDLGKLNFSYGELDPPFSADVYDYVLKVQHCTSLKYHLLSNMMDAGTDSAQPETSRVRRLQESAPNETFMNTPPFEVDDGVDMIAGTPVVEMRSVYQYDVDHLWWLLLIIFPFTNKATGSNLVFLALAVLYFISGLLPVCVSSVIFSLPMTLSIDTRDGLLPAMTAVLPIAANALSFLVLCSEFPRTADAIASAPWQIELGVLVSLCVMLGEMVTDQYHPRDKKSINTSLMEQHSQVTPLLMMEYKLFMAERSRKGAVALKSETSGHHIVV